LPTSTKGSVPNNGSNHTQLKFEDWYDNEAVEESEFEGLKEKLEERQREDDENIAKFLLENEVCIRALYIRATVNHFHRVIQLQFCPAL
jgi:hypothetical protein